MFCREVMKDEIECVLPEDPVQDAAALMRDENVGFLPVCDSSRRVLGTLTDRDIAIRLVADNKPASTLVREIMTHEVVSCSPDDEIRTAEELMATSHKSRIMCIDDDGTLAGVISLSDIAQYEQSAQVHETLRQVSEREARI